MPGVPILKPHTKPIALLAVLVALSTGCATSSQARSVKPTGFLGEQRSLLRPGKPGEEELLVYRNPEANWPAYRKILLERVTIWEDRKRKLSSDEKKDLRRLAEGFEATLRQKLAADYEMVEQAGPDVMRIQAAITDSQQSDTVLKVASKAAPFPISTAASVLWSFASGKPPFVGEVSMEILINDALTGNLLSASADRRVGADTIVSGSSLNTQYLNSWGDVKSSLDFWTDDVVYRLCVLRGGTACVQPKKGLKLPG